MQTGNNDIIVHTWTVEETPWTYELSQQDLEAESDQFAIYKSLAACVLTTAMNITTAQLSKESGNESCGNIYPYPTCDSRALKDSVRLPLFIGQPTWCEIYLFLITVMTCLHWGCIFSLFNQPRWKTQFLPHIIMATLITLLPFATITRDPTTVFLRLLPIVTDIYTFATVAIDYARERKLRFRSST
ncbi:hypothetical protein J3E68DRAFT_91863 [Trichoderma sp. SZMC 28012]